MEVVGVYDCLCQRVPWATKQSVLVISSLLELWVLLISLLSVPLAQPDCESCVMTPTFKFCPGATPSNAQG